MPVTVRIPGVLTKFMDGRAEVEAQARTVRELMVEQNETRL